MRDHTDLWSKRVSTCEVFDSLLEWNGSFGLIEY